MNIQQLMKQAQGWQKKIGDAQAEIENLEVTGESGGGMVKVTMTVKGSLQKVWIDPSIVSPEDKEMLEDLIVAAFNDAGSKAKEKMEEKMDSLGIPPDLMKMGF